MLVFFQLPAPHPPKKRKRLGELGCEGAFFLPTETRTVAVDRLTKASFVETHVNSLRPVSNENAGLPRLILLFTSLWNYVLLLMFIIV